MGRGICYCCFRELDGASGTCPHCGYDPALDVNRYPLAMPHGTILGGRYILGRVLGQGGFGITYVAQDYKTKSLVAIKEYFPDTMAMRTGGRTVSAYSSQREESFFYGRKCFLEEARTLAEFLGNPNIVRVHSYFEENGTAYFVMEYVEGISLQRYIQDHGGKIPWQDAKNILLPVIDALASVHAKGIIHRDVTPDNICITRDGTVKLLDFGAARYSLGDQSRSLDVVLKHGFAPKEQYARHGRQGPYTDVYSLAATFYYAVTGRCPPDSIDRTEEDDLVLPSSLGISIPPQVEDALVKGLSVYPADRFQSMTEFRQALEPERTPEDDAGRKQEEEENKPTRFRKRKWFLPAGAAAAAALILTVVLIAANGKSPDDAVQPEAGPAAETLSVPEPSDAAEAAPAAGDADNAQTPIDVGDISGILPDSGQEETAPAVETVNLPVKKTMYNEDGSIDYSTETSYNEYGEEILWYVFNGDGSVKSWHEYEYDGSGNRVKSTRFQSDGSLDEWTDYTYDEQGCKLTSRNYQADGTPDSWSEYEYDENGRWVRYIYHSDGTDAVDSWTEYTYDAYGNKTGRIEYKSDGSVSERDEYEYDGQGNRIRSVSYDGSGEKDYWYTYVYDADGNEVEHTQFRGDGSVANYYETTYDARGNKITWTSFDEDGTVECQSTTEYAYDIEGHILKSTYYWRDKLDTVTEYIVTEVLIRENP